MKTLPPEVYEEDFVQIPVDTHRRVVEKAMQGVTRAKRNKDCGRITVSLFLLALAALFVKHNLESPIGLIELELVIFISCMIYCLAICIVAGERQTKIEAQ
jgi:hypothetical protein